MSEAISGQAMPEQTTVTPPAAQPTSLTITEKAVNEIKRIQANDPTAVGTNLRVMVVGGGCSGMSYKLGFDAQPLAASDKIFEKDGVKVFRDTEKGTEWSPNNTCGIQHIYPAGAIGPDSDPKWLEVARNTIRVMNRWIDNNGMSSIYPAAVRVGYDPQVVLKELRSMVETKGGTNGFTNGIVEGVENCSIVPNTVNEMLCMGHGHVVRVFPSWPKDKDARFANLRTWGAFLVSGEQQGGVVRQVAIRSERGRNCTVVNPWGDKSIEVFRDGKKAETVKGGRITLKTAVGECLELRPAGG